MRTQESAGFGTIASRLAFLLNKTPDDTVLLVGERPARHEEAFRDYFRQCDRSVCAPRTATQGATCCRQYGLVLWDTTSSGYARKDVHRDAMALCNFLADSGHLIAIWDNPCCPRNARRLLADWRSGRRGKGIRLVWPGAIEKMLLGTGLSSVRVFLPMPGIDDIEELVSSQSKNIQLPGYFHPFLRAANRLGFYGAVHDGFVAIASKGTHDHTECLTVCLSEGISERRGIPSKLALDRFDLRGRSGLILFLRDLRSRTGWIAKVAVTPTIEGHIRTNALWLERLRNDPSMPREVRERIPPFLGSFEYRGTRVYVEGMIEGTIAWKIRDEKLLKRVDDHALTFIRCLGRSTRRLVTINVDSFGVLIDNDVYASSPALRDSSRLCQPFDRILRWLRNCMIGRNMHLVVGQGDFGYGNIIADQATGAIRAVIDWNDARELEVPGVDWINFLIQKERSKRGASFKDAVTRLGTGVVGALQDSRLCSYQDPCIHTAGVELAQVFSLSCIRYVLRAARYGELSSADKQDYAGALSWIASHLAEQD